MNDLRVGQSFIGVQPSLQHGHGKTFQPADDQPPGMTFNAGNGKMRNLSEWYFNVRLHPLGKTRKARAKHEAQLRSESGL